MAFVTWLPNAGGDWDTASDWSGGVLPTSADTVVISTTTEQTITHSTGNDFAGSLSVGNDLFSMTGGTLTVVGTVSMANGFSMSGGVSSMGTTASITGTFTQTGGILSVGGTLTVAGEALLQGGTLTASTILQASGPVVLSNDTIGGQAQIQNTTVIYQTGNITLGDSSGVGALIATAAGASYDFANAVSVGRGAATAQITNAGTLAALAGTGASAINVSATSTGVISAAAGSSLAYQGPISTLSGTITGAGTVSIAGGTATLAGSTVVNVGTFSIYNAGTDLVLGGNLGISSALSDSTATTLSLAGHTLTLTGSANFSFLGGQTPTITGAGTLITKGPTSINGTGTALSIGSTVAWDNYGTVTDAQVLQIGTSASGTAAVVNEAGGVFDLTANGVVINNGSTPVSTLKNTGTLAMIANGGTAYLGIDVTSTKLITSAATDNVEFDAAANSISGSIAGQGQVSFANAGTTTISGGTKITVGTIALYTRGTNLGLAGSVTDTGSYTQSDGTTLTLSASTFIIAGSALFQQNNGNPLLTGTGTLVTKGTTTLGGGTPLIVGGSAAWLNNGVVNQSGYLQIGDSNTSSASVTNASGATLLMSANNIHIANGSTSARFVNAGTLEMTTNAGTGYDDVVTSSTGTILAAQGTNLVFDAATNSFAGALTGAGQISFAAGIDMIAAGTTLTAAELAIYGNTTVSLLGAETIAGMLSLGSTSTLTLGGATTISGALNAHDSSVISLGANVLTLNGSAQFYQDSGALPDIRGSGTFTTQGTTSLIGTSTALTIGASATWSNTGTVFDSALLQIGDTNGLSAAVVNAAGGLFDLLATGVAINNGSTPYSSFTNAGTLEMAANGGTANINLIASSTGTVLVLQGDNLQFDGSSTSLAGTLTGAGQISISGGSGTIAGGTVSNIGTLAEYNNGTSLTLGGDVTNSGSFYQGSASTLILAGHTLTLAGNAEFQQSGGSPLVTGPGTLITDGVTTLNGQYSPALVVGGTAAWDNNGTVLDYQSFQIGNSGSAAASVVNEAGATFDLVAGVGVNNGSTPVSSFTNAGLFEMTNFGGTSSLNESFTNTGTVLAQGGRMNFLGPVSGTGTLDISAGGTLAFSSTVTSAATVDFLDSTGSLFLTLTTPTAFAAKISDFVQGDKIDLVGISNATGTFSKGVLTFTNNTSGAAVATLHFTNAPNFTFTSDGNGGTLIGDPHK